MDPNFFSLAMYALKYGDPAIQSVAKEAFDECSEKGCIKAKLIRAMIHFTTWKNNSNMVHLRIALDELRKLPLYYILENLPKIVHGEEALQMLLPLPPERKRKSEEE